MPARAQASRREESRADGGRAQGRSTARATRPPRYGVDVVDVGRSDQAEIDRARPTQPSPEIDVAASIFPAELEQSPALSPPRLVPPVLPAPVEAIAAPPAARPRETVSDFRGERDRGAGLGQQDNAARPSVMTSSVTALPTSRSPARGTGVMRTAGQRAPVADFRAGRPPSRSLREQAITPSRMPLVERPAAPQATSDAADSPAVTSSQALAPDEAPPQGRAAIDLIMPPAPDRPSPNQVARIETSTRSASRAASRARDLPNAEASTAAARQGVTEPEAETRGRAEAAVAETLVEQSAPSPAILELCRLIRDSIREKRPVDEDELVNTDPQGVADEAGRALNQRVEGEADNVTSSYDALQQPPSGEARQVGRSIETPPSRASLPELQAADAAAPDPIPDDNLRLDVDQENARAQVAAAGMDTPAARVVESGPIAEARAAQGEFGALAERSPAELAAAQSQAIADAQADMAALQQQMLENLQAGRHSTVRAVARRQGGMVTSEEATRRRVSTEARRIFRETQTAVNGPLQQLPRIAMAMWDAGIDSASTRFEQSLARVKTWIDERHSGVGGAILGVVDAITGLPGWVTEEYDRAEQRFGDDVCAVLVNISGHVNRVVATSDRLISNARDQIDALFDYLPDNLRAWAEEEKARFNGQLDQLGERVQSARTEITSGLRERAISAVAEVQQRVEALREEARGILGRIADAIAAFVEDPAKFIIEGILRILGIAPAAFWALVARIERVISDIANDPLAFANNLVSALAEGFRKFFDNFVDHIIGGFFDWLFSGLGAVGVNIPSDFSLKSIITFALELMGITWPRIREILARHIGEENVALLEKAYELISTLIEQGPEGIFEMIKERLNPQEILNQIISAAVDYLVEALIRAVTPRVIALFNPAGAIVQAVEVIFRVLKWIFENAARIFSLVETVVNGVADLIAGNISGMATAVEGALARLITPVIDFLAGFLGLGDLPEKIADTIRGFQEMVLSVIDRVVAWLADRARSLLRALGIGEEDIEEGEEDDGELIVETFSMEGEPHTLTIDPERGRVTLASDASPLAAQIAAGKEKLREHEGNATAEEAKAILQRMQGLLDEIQAELESNATPRQREQRRSLRPQLRQFSRETKQALEHYGERFKVKEIVDGLPEFGPVVVAPHPARPEDLDRLTQPDGSTRESHHVPPKELAQTLATRIGETARVLEGEDQPGATAAAILLRDRERTIKDKKESGKDLSAILLHRVTHQNAGGTAVHAAAMRGEIVADIHRIDAASDREKLQIINRIGGDLSVNPNRQAINFFLERLNEQLDEEEDRAIAAQIDADVAEIDEETAQDARASAEDRLRLLIQRAFDDSLDQGIAAVRRALTHSILDGPETERMSKVGELHDKATDTWKKEKILT